jgi:hypothetical protein
MFKGIILHWTAGNYKPCSTDIEHYHFIIDGDGNVYEGKYKPRDNENCADGKYAAHCGGGNTGRIGISICCRKNINTAPTKKQIEAMCKQAAELCSVYGISVNNVQTHAEFGLEHPKTTSYGKIDINSIPYENISGVDACGNYLRNKIQWYYNKIKRK